MFYKLSSIILNAKQKSRTFGEVFICQPDTDKEALAGKMFILIEIASKKVWALKIVNFLIDNIERNYYQNEKIILKEKISELKVEHFFETALAKTNKDFNAFLFAEKIKISINDIDITVGIAYKNELHFSQNGKNKSFIICGKEEKKQPTKSHGATNIQQSKPENKIQYQMLDVGQNDHNANNQTNGKLFSNVISGAIPASAYAFFSNETLSEYLSNKQLIDIITKLPPAGAAGHIKNILIQANTYVSFLGIIIKSTIGIPETEKYEQSNQTAQSSISKLCSTEEQTEKLLISLGAINFKKKIKLIFHLLLKIKNYVKSALKIKQNKKIFQKKQIFKQAITKGKNLIIYIFNLFNTSIKICNNTELRKQFLYKIKLFCKKCDDKIIDKLKKILQATKQLSIKSKILFFIFIVCLILLILNISLIKKQNENIEQQRSLEFLIKHIEQKQNQIDANLLYKNEEGAKKILNELKNLFEKTLEYSGEQLYQKLVQKNNEQLEKIRRIIKVDNKVELVNFKNFNDQSEVASIILINNKIYCKDKNKKIVYVFDLLNNSATTTVNLEEQHKNFQHPIVDKNQNIYYFNFNNNNAVQFDIKTKKISSLIINLPLNANPVAVANFNNKLYLLDKDNSQIYRYIKDSKGFTKPEKWLKEKSDFSNVVDLSIDGHIYILKENGIVLKYLNGKSEEFVLDLVDPLFAKATKIIVSPKFNFIYILDPINNRLVVFNKTGKFLMQYHSNKFMNLSDFAINEEKKKIYFLDRNSVYEVQNSNQ